MQSLNQPQVGEDLYWECHFKLSASPPIMETWKISLLPTLFYLFLADIPFKGHLLVWMSSRQLPTFIPCCLPKHSFKPKFVPMPTAVITINELKWLNHLRPEGKCLHSVSVTICFMGSVDCTCQTFAFINRVVWCPGPFFLLLNHPQLSLADSECHECYTRRNKLGWGHQTALRSYRGCSALFGFKCPISAGKMHYQHQPQSSPSKNRTCGVRTRLVYLKNFVAGSRSFIEKQGSGLATEGVTWTGKEKPMVLPVCSTGRWTNLHPGTANIYKPSNQAMAPVDELEHIWRTTSLCRGMNEKGFSLWKEKVYMGVYNYEREDKICNICLGLIPQIWVNPVNFHSTRELQPRSIPDQSLIKGKFPGDLTFVKIIHLDILAMNVSSSLSCSAFDLEANFDQWFYSSFGHRGFCISSWILLHKVFFVHWKAGELAPCEPVEFIKPASTNLSWLLLQK